MLIVFLVIGIALIGIGCLIKIRGDASRDFYKDAVNQIYGGLLLREAVKGERVMAQRKEYK